MGQGRVVEEPFEMNVTKFLQKKYKLILAFTIPLTLSPILVFFNDSEPAKCTYVLLLMAFYWVFLPIPVCITGLIPLVMFPVMGIVSMEDVCKTFMTESVILLISAIIVSSAVERYNLHRRLALRTLLFAGSEPKRLLLSLMITAAFLSMWIMNMAVYAMLFPIVQVLVEELENKLARTTGMVNSAYEQELHKNGKVTRDENALEMSAVIEENCTGMDEQQQKTSHPGDVTRNDTKGPSRLMMCFNLGLVQALIIGGVGTLVGTFLPLVLVQNLETYYGPSAKPNFGEWMVYAIPTQIVCLALAWTWLSTFFLDLGQSILLCFSGRSNCLKKKQTVEGDIVAVLRKQYDELGAIKWSEVVVIFIFVVLIVMWLFEDPQFVTGWRSWFKPGFVKSSTFTVAVTILCFIIPNKRPSLPRCTHDIEKFEPLLDWQYVVSRVPWDIVFFAGGGVSLTVGIKESGLDLLVADKLDFLNSWDPWIVLLITTAIGALLTEFLSGPVYVGLILPIVYVTAHMKGIHPYYFAIPITQASNLSFCLPAAHPLNAMLVSFKVVTVPTMAKVGVMLNFLCLIITNISMNTFGWKFFDIDTVPAWAVIDLVNATTTVASVTV
ncbi:Na(+)/citrate cotransporter-like [Saccoglossus kowalevskii]